MTDPLRVLFVCTANICRSPFMELLAGRLAQGDLHVESAGTHGLIAHRMDRDMSAELAPRGLAPDAHEGFRSRPLTRDLVEGADVVLTAEVAHRRFVLDEQPATFRKVFTLGQFAEAVEDAAAEGDGTTGRELLRLVGSRRPPADVRLDVPDPYGRGRETAAACAERMEALLRVVVPALTGSGRIPA